MALFDRLRKSRILAKRGNPLLKSIDRAGIPVVWLLGVPPARRMPPPSELRHIGFLRTAAVGDTLLLSGVLRDTRAQFPDAAITLLTGNENAQAGSLALAGIGRLVVLPLSRPLSAVGALRREGLDVLIDTGSWPRFDAVLTALSGARFRVGFRTARQFRHYAYDAAVDHASQVHESANFRALGRAIGTTASHLPSISREGLECVPETPRKPFVVLHPWAGGYRGEIREWPNERWVELATRLRRRVDSFLVTGAPSQADRTERLVAQLRARSLSANGSTHAVRDVAAILSESEVVIGVNTSITHLGALLGVPAVVLDGPTGPRRWGLIGPRVASVMSELPGCGFLDLGYEYAGHRTDCMLGISVDAVERAVLQILGGAT
jgi:heptosyltransferase-3